MLVSGALYLRNKMFALAYSLGKTRLSLIWPMEQEPSIYNKGRLMPPNKKNLINTEYRADLGTFGSCSNISVTYMLLLCILEILILNKTVWTSFHVSLISEIYFAIDFCAFKVINDSHSCIFTAN